ncbi:MAG: hypothetical protein HYU57_08785 [Micavibrio aeruginosavorus]|nr:hypothetical protein [Micavibrio aeruginosavorus]
MRSSRFLGGLLSLAVIAVCSSAAMAQSGDSSVLTNMLKNKKPMPMQSATVSSSSSSSGDKAYEEAIERARQQSLANDARREQLNFEMRQKRSAEIRAALEVEQKKVMIEEEKRRQAIALAEQEKNAAPGTVPAALGTEAQQQKPAVAERPKNKVFTAKKKSATDDNTPRRLFNVR